MEQTMLEGFERFTRKGRSFKPRVSIRARGQMGFNNGAVLRFELDKYEYVILYYSKEKNLIAIEPTNNANEDGAIKLVKKTGNYFFSGKSFLDYYSIEYGKKTINCEVKSEGKNLIVVSLDICEEKQ
ncbi:MAG: hypothetical protein WCJ37_06085 [Syntrophus sp. (in: bacteria)]